MNKLPQIRANILAALASASVVRIAHPRPLKLARELRKELRMCDVTIEKDGRHDVLSIRWKTVD